MAQQQPQQLLGEPTKFFELEHAVQSLRPLVIEVLRTQMYHNSQSAVNLRRGIRHVREICKQLRAETVLLAKHKKDSSVKGEQQQYQQQSYEPSLKRAKIENTPAMENQLQASTGISSIVGMPEER